MYLVLRQESEDIALLKLMNSGTLPKGSLLNGREGLRQTIKSFDEARQADLVNEALPPTKEERARMGQERTQKIQKDLEKDNESPVFQRLIRKLSS